MQVIGCAGRQAGWAGISKQELAIALLVRVAAVGGDAAAPRVTHNHKRTQCSGVVWCGCGGAGARDIFWASQGKVSVVIMVAGAPGRRRRGRCVSDRV
jgi:hypothetical protein